jgi:hypothetical protein
MLEKDIEIRGTLFVESKEALHSQGGKRNIHYKMKRIADWVGHILRMNCLLKHDTEGKLEEKSRRGRRRKQLLVDLRKIKGTGT